MATRTEPTGETPAPATSKAAPVSSDTLNKLAFSLFTQRSVQAGRAPEATALQCFKDAAAFLAVSDKVVAGELTTAKPATSRLSDACAPNLKPTHPLNLISQRFGNEKTLAKAKEINEKLKADPAMETFSEFDWDIPTVNTARAILPAYCN